jgi:galactose mutarotase-like enzyme
MHERSKRRDDAACWRRQTGREVGRAQHHGRVCRDETVLSAQIRLPVRRRYADRYTPVGATLIPDGELALVSGTPFDFRTPTAIGARIDAVNEQLHRAGGYDHNFVLQGNAGTLREAAFAEGAVTRRTLTLLTTEPGVQFYSGNFLDGSAIGSSGTAYKLGHSETKSAGE